ncbi:hypothetical protein SHAM105786_13775 [Shewanella amazonensis]
MEKDDLLRLSDTQLEELLARLAEAEVAANGHSPAWVSWSGSINAPDGGIDIHVQIPVAQLNTGFLERADTILQAKKHSMPNGAITKEMTTNGVLTATISEQASKGGSYIIVSLNDDCSPTMMKDHLAAMRNAVKDDTCGSNIHLDFYDRSKLIQWLRQHPCHAVGQGKARSGILRLAAIRGLEQSTTRCHRYSYFCPWSDD